MDGRTNGRWHGRVRVCVKTEGGRGELVGVRWGALAYVYFEWMWVGRWAGEWLAECMCICMSVSVCVFVCVCVCAVWTSARRRDGLPDGVRSDGRLRGRWRWRQGGARTPATALPSPLLPSNRLPREIVARLIRSWCTNMSQFFFGQNFSPKCRNQMEPLFVGCGSRSLASSSWYKNAFR